MQWYEEIMDAAQEAVDYVGAVLCQGNGAVGSVRQVLVDFCAAMDGVAVYLSNDKGTLVEKCRRYALNTAHSAQKTIDAQTSRDAHNYFTFEVRPLFLDLRYQLDLEYRILRHPETHEAYLAQTLAVFEAARKRLRRTNFKYRVSIIVPAYNKVEFSRCAIESLFRYTDFSRGDMELITINDGSSDGTEAYFNSLPHEKKINLKHNVYNHLGWGIARHIVEGEYVVYFSNDAVATPHWLENLLKIHETMPDVFWAVPTCSKECISNNQGISVDYENTFEDMGKMEEFASRHNVSNPLLWEERAVLMPFVSVVPNLFDVPEMRADYRYVMCDFEDDDFSTMLRRTGFKQILAKDTFVHHFGGVTLKEVRNLPKNRGSLVCMRPVFREKWKVDPWESRGHVMFLNESLEKASFDYTSTRVLVIEPLFGESLLCVRNYFHRKQQSVVVDAIVTDMRYLSDCKYMADNVWQLSHLDNFTQHISANYDIVLIGNYLNRLPVRRVISFFMECHAKLRPRGFIQCGILNYSSFNRTMQWLPNNISPYAYQEMVSVDGDRIFPVDLLLSALRKNMSDAHIDIYYTNMTSCFQGIDRFESLIGEILGSTEKEKMELHHILLGDIVILHIS